MGNVIGLVALIFIVTLTSYLAGFVMGYEFNTKEAEDGRVNGTTVHEPGAWGKDNKDSFFREESKGCQ